MVAEAVVEADRSSVEEKFHQTKAFIVNTAGKIAYDYFYSGSTSNTLKEDLTVVTQVDKDVETVLVNYIHENFPDDSIYGEEFGKENGTSGFTWFLDPIDGTDNFVRHVPFFGISVARLGDDSEGSFAIIHNPATKQTFSSFKEELGGVFENGRLCTITPEPLGGKTILTISAASKKGEWIKPAKYALMEEIGLKYGRGGSYNCCALELAYVAANRIDADLIFGLDPYDYAAGLFLAKAAGGEISVFEDGKWQTWDSNLKDLCLKENAMIFVSHPSIHQSMLDFIGDPKSWAEKSTKKLGPPPREEWDVPGLKNWN